MRTEENKAVVHRLIDEYWNGQRSELFDDIYAAEYVDHNLPPGSPPGREGARQFNSVFLAALPDIRITLDDLVAEGDKVVWRWTAQGTHQGPLMGIPASGKPVAMSGITIERVVEGRITESWTQYDAVGLLQQVGAMPSHA
jgi:steroid delta-isomerase-like uncharacterized protein